ncbi:MAG: hypothetical protein AAGK32_00630 [Actinomycetota bacterium]
MSAIEIYGLIGWAAAAAMGLVYLLGGTRRLSTFGTFSYFALGITAFAMVVLRFAEAF